MLAVLNLEILSRVSVQILPVIFSRNLHQNSSKIPYEIPTRMSSKILAEIFQAFLAPIIARESSARISEAIPANISTKISSGFPAEITGKMRRRIYGIVHPQRHFEESLEEAQQD